MFVCYITKLCLPLENVIDFDTNPVLNLVVIVPVAVMLSKVGESVVLTP